MRFIWFNLVVFMSLSAAPMLRLTPTTLGPLSLAVGTNGPTQTLFAYNGGGALNVSASSTAAWAPVSVGSPQPCAQGTCVPIVVSAATASLPKGTYNAYIIISAPGAVDAPRMVLLTVYMGGAVPNEIDLIGDVPVIQTAIETASQVHMVNNGAPWLTIADPVPDGPLFRYILTAQPPTSGSAVSATIQISGSTLSADNKTVVVRLIYRGVVWSASPSSLQTLLPMGAQQTFPIRDDNSEGTLIVSATTSVSNGGNWLTATPVAPLEYGASLAPATITINASNLAPGTYDGNVSFTAVRVPGTPAGPVYADNNPVVIPVEVTVIPAGPPILSYMGAADGATFNSVGGLAPGELASVFGLGLLLQDPASATSVPLPDSLAGVQLFVNDLPVPLLYVSENQVNFQLPSEAVAGINFLHIQRGALASNTISFQIVPASPRIFSVPTIVTPTGTAPAILNSSKGELALGIYSVQRGIDSISIFATGLGATVPSIADGVAAPANPLAAAASTSVCFHAEPGTGDANGQTCVLAQFAGLAPGFVGLYQINAPVPLNAASGDEVPLYLQIAGVSSNIVSIPIE